MLSVRKRGVKVEWNEYNDMSMIEPKGRPPYRLAYCPRQEAERAEALPPEIRARFSAAELSELQSLPPRRLRDRLAGRLAAKRALAEHFAEEEGWIAEPRDLEIFNDDAGRPFLRLPPGAMAAAPSFSIAHCAEGGAAAVGGAGRRVGVDLETVVARPAEVIAFVSAPREGRSAGPGAPEAQARLWTAKEAALKLLGLGLDADARAVRPEAESVAFTGLPAEVWRELGSPRVRLAYERIEGAMLAVAFTGD